MTAGRSTRFVLFFTAILAQCFLLYSLPAVILAPVAISHDLEASAVGVVVGIFGLFFSLGVLIVGLLLPSLGLGFSLTTGALMCGTFSHLCGLVLYFSSKDVTFTVLFSLLRGLTGFSSGAMAGAILASLPLFHTTGGMRRVPVAVASAATLGLGIGPSLGGAVALLAGSFHAPFAVLGTLFFVEGIVIYPLLKEDNIACPDVPGLLWFAGKRPLVLVAALHVTAVCVSIGLMIIVLEPFLCGGYDGQASPTQIGSLFLFTVPSGVLGIIPYDCDMDLMFFWISYIVTALPLFLFASHSGPSMNEALVTLFVLSMCFGIAVPSSLHGLSAEIKRALDVRHDVIPSCTLAPFLFSIAAGLGMAIGAFAGGCLVQKMDEHDAAGTWGYVVMIYAGCLTVFIVVCKIWPQRSGTLRDLSISEELDSEERRPLIP